MLFLYLYPLISIHPILPLHLFNVFHLLYSLDQSFNILDFSHVWGVARSTSELKVTTAIILKFLKRQPCCYSQSIRSACQWMSNVEYLETTKKNWIFTINFVQFTIVFSLTLSIHYFILIQNLGRYDVV